jgi:hypothetical protein
MDGFNAVSGSPTGHREKIPRARHSAPTRTVLTHQTMLLKDDRCLVHPCIDPLFGPTQSDDYASNLTP